MDRIVVGVDASQGADTALEWACAEAAFHGAKLEIVAAYTHPWVPGTPTDEVTAMDPAYHVPRQEAEHRLDQALRLLGDRAEGLDITTLAIDDAPARALLRQAADADLLVVGTRGRGGFTGLLLGSVSQQCAQHAPCPVVVVPATPAREPFTGRPTES
jgi:nucleotide-binding universal stress UspA family protein